MSTDRSDFRVGDVVRALRDSARAIGSSERFYCKDDLGLVIRIEGGDLFVQWFQQKEPVADGKWWVETPIELVARVP